MITYLIVTTYAYDANANLQATRERLPFRRTRESAVFPSSGPDLFPANVHERGCPSYFRLVPGYTAAYAGVRYVDFADWCRKWGVELVVHEPVGGAA